MEGSLAGADRARTRLLVLGAGPAQLGLLRAARERGLFVIAVDRDPSAPGFSYADRRALISTEDEPAIDRLARAESVDGIISPGIDWPVGIAARVAERLGLPHPIDARDRGARRPRSRGSGSGSPRPACRSRALRSSDAASAPCVVKAPDRQGQQGWRSCAPRRSCRPRSGGARGVAQRRCIVEELVDGPEVTVNAFSVAAVPPLTVTDRLTAEPPAFGVALAHVWPSAERKAVEAARAAAEALGVRDGPTYTQLRIGPDGPRDRARCAPRRRPRRRARRGRVGRRPERPRARRRARRTRLVLRTRARTAARASASSSRPRASSRVEGRGGPSGRGRAGRAHLPRARHVFGPFRRGADRAGAVLAVGDSRDEALARAAPRDAYASSS